MTRLQEKECSIFQSTLPIQGETATSHKEGDYEHISIHSPYTGRDGPCGASASRPAISIHSPYTGRDRTTSYQRGSTTHFNPLSLYRERRSFVEFADRQLYFNPLSLYRERPILRPFFWHTLYFNPLSLYRERPKLSSAFVAPVPFQSTLPIQGETPEGHRHHHHSLYFNPLSLYRERPTFF